MQVPVAVKSVKHVEVLQMEYQDEDVHVPVPQISRYQVYKLLKVRHNFHHWKISKVSDVDDMQFLIIPENIERLSQAYCANALTVRNYWIQIGYEYYVKFT